MAGTYDKGGVRFLYPENWELNDQPTDELPRVISVGAPEGGFWALHVCDRSVEPDALAAEVLGAMTQEYDSLESEEVMENIGSARMCGYDMEFYCLDLVVSARARGFRKGNHTFLVLAQAESRDFEKLGEVFRAMTVSLLADAGIRH